METNKALHPADETLVRYGLGKLDDTIADSVDKHLEQCPTCRRRVGELPSDDFVALLCEAARPPVVADSVTPRPPGGLPRPSQRPIRRQRFYPSSPDTSTTRSSGSSAAGEWETSTWFAIR